ncbi:MAG: hypothetical protein RL308_114 [Bacteroidota bacterium]
MLDKTEMEIINGFNDFQLAQYFLDNLIVRATGGLFDDQYYTLIRRKLIADKSLKALLPEWLERTRTADQFWTFIKSRYSTYEERRIFLRDEFEALLFQQEMVTTTPLPTTIIFDEVFIHDHWKKAIDLQQSDPESAITAARTLIEAVLKYILDEKEIEYKEHIELPDLYKLVSKSLNLAPEQHQDQIFKQILGGASSIITGLGTVRNKLGDAHGKSKTSVKPKSRHSELAVNMAGSMGIFLLRTFKETESNRHKIIK